MKRILSLAIVVILLVIMAPMAMAADVTVYVSVSVDGELELAAQPVTVSELTVDSAIKAAHANYYSGGEVGYSAATDPTWNMFMINKVWGVSGTPYVIVNDEPIGTDMSKPTADTYPIKHGDNIIISVSSNMMKPALAISMTVSVSDEMATISAKSWTLDFMTFAYTSSPFAGAKVIDPETGEALGTTDSNGNITVPAEGKAAIDGLAAIPVDGSSTSTSDSTAQVPLSSVQAAPSGASITVYVSVSIDGELELAAKPVAVSNLTVDAAIREAHKVYYPAGEAGYSAATDPIWNMFMINRVWGVSNTPFVIVNGTPIGVDSTKPNNVASYPINEGDNIIISVSSTMSPAKAVSLTVSTENGSSTVIATAWEMDFTTFQYTSKPLVGADIINPETGELLGTTDAEGRITVPAVGIVAADGVAAVLADGSSAATPDTIVTPRENFSPFGGNSFGGGFGSFENGSFGGFGGFGDLGDLGGFGGVSFSTAKTASPEENKIITYSFIGAMLLVPILFAVGLHILNHAYMKDKTTIKEP